MPSTIQVQRSITLASAFVRYAPLTMSANDPALSNADWVRQFILGAPFAWRWNRVVTQFTTIIGKTDYTEALPALGWIEKAVGYLPTNGNETFELEVENNLMVETTPNQPTKIAAQLDDDTGNITFRIFPAPDDIYTIEVTYQKAAPTFTALTDTWQPVPDYYSYLYNQGLQAKTYEYLNDPRFQTSMQLFLQSVVGANEGLSDAQKSIFLFDRLNAQRQTQNVQQGKA
jgi:hypothetical protein